MEVLPYCNLNKKGIKLLKGKNAELPEEYQKIGLPAHKAATSGDVESLQSIFLALADVGVPVEDTYGSTPLHIAAKNNDAKVANWLLDYTDIDRTAQAKKGETAFHVAAAQGNLKVLEIMVLHDPNLKEFIATCLDDTCFTPLHLAIVRHHNQIVRFLISKLGSKAIGSINESGVNSAHVAASVGNIDALKLIYNKNKKVLHLVAKDLTTPIFFAAQEGHFTALQYLHQKGKCDLGSRSFDGMSPIHAACQNGHLEIIQYITSKLGKSAKFDQTPDGSTPLHFAACAGHEEIVRWLVNNDLTGTIAFIQDNNGDTPAHDAADNGHTEILKILLENGADIHAANKDGSTPYALASQGPYEDTAAFALKYATASPSSEDSKPSKMRIFDLENAQKDRENGKDESPTELSPYDSMTSTAKEEIDHTESSNEKLLEWNKEEIGLFDESKTKPSHLTSLATQEYAKRTSKRQARKMTKSIKDHITQTGGTHETLFKPHMNINPLVETSSKADTAKADHNEVNGKPNPEVVKSKSIKEMNTRAENITAVVNEFFDEEEPQGDGELPDPHPANLTSIDKAKEDINQSDEPNDSAPDENTSDMEPLITKDGESSTTQSENIISIDEDKAIDTQPSPIIKDAPVSDNVRVEEDDTVETHTATLNVEQTIVTEQEIVTTETNEEEDNDEVKGIVTTETSKEEANDEVMGIVTTETSEEEANDEVKGIVTTETNEEEANDEVIEDADNVPLIDVKKSSIKTPSSPGKFGLKQAKRKEISGFTAPNQDSQSGASDELKKAFAKYRNK